MQNKIVVLLVAITTISPHVTHAKRIYADKRKLHDDVSLEAEELKLHQEAANRASVDGETQALNAEDQDDELHEDATQKMMDEFEKAKVALGTTKEDGKAKASQVDGANQTSDLASGPPLTIVQASNQASIPSFNVKYVDGSEEQYVRVRQIQNAGVRTDPMGMISGFKLEWALNSITSGDSAPDYVVRLLHRQPRHNPNWKKPSQCDKGVPDSGVMVKNVICIQAPTAKESDPCLYTIWRNKYTETQYFMYQRSGDGKHKELVAQATCERNREERWFNEKEDSKRTEAQKMVDNLILPKCTFYAASCPGKLKKENPLGRAADNMVGLFEYIHQSRKLTLHIFHVNFVNPKIQDPLESDWVGNHHLDMYLTFASSLVRFGWVDINPSARMLL